MKTNEGVSLTSVSLTWQQESEIWEQGYHEGREDGAREALADLPLPFGDEFVRRLRFNPLEEITVRWDAALKRWVWTQDGVERWTEEADV
jgi:hypothetical protein